MCRRLRLAAGDPDPRLDPPRRERDAAEQPAAADRDHQRVELGHVLEHLERDGALTGDHRRVVVGVDEGERFARFELARVARGVGQAVAFEHDFGAVYPRVGDLRVGRAPGHHDHRAHAQPRGVVGDALGVVARAHRDHAAAALLLAQRQQLVERAALLERAGELQVLELEPDLGTGEVRQRAAVKDRRSLDRARDAHCGGLHVLECDGSHVRLNACMNITL